MGKAVAEPKKKKTHQEEWDHVLSVPDTQFSLRGAFGSERVHRVRGSSPRVSSSSRLSSNSSYVSQAEVSHQSR
jgi:hypothetical protein